VAEKFSRKQDVVPTGRPMNMREHRVVAAEARSAYLRCWEPDPEADHACAQKSTTVALAEGRSTWGKRVRHARPAAATIRKDSRSLSRAPGCACAVSRRVRSLLQGGRVRKEDPGVNDLPSGERQPGPQHVVAAECPRRHGVGGPARPACQGESCIA
jgi:hypothetical protein